MEKSTSDAGLLTGRARELISRYSDEGHDTSGHLHVLYTLARWCVPKPMMLEIGIRGGISTVALLAGAAESGGTLMSIDHDSCSVRTVTSIVESLGLQDAWRPHVAHSDSFVNECPDGMDLLWIDGDHSYEQVLKDTQNYVPKLRAGGWLVMHDACLEGAGQDGVTRIVPTLRMSGEYESVTVFPWGYGLLIARKAQA